jgi:glycine/sarcosine N-methyltransferase
MYDDFSTDYDRFVNWPGRLALELPFLQSQLEQTGAKRVLDSACGTGMHAIALSQAGFEAAGADISAGMIQRARANAQAANLPVAFKTAGFGELAGAFGKAQLDAVLCLGNSLPHLLSEELVEAALQDFAGCLRPGGLLILQNRNFETVMEKKLRWMEPQEARQGDEEWLFLRFYDFEPDGLLTFNILSLHRQGESGWTQRLRSTPLRPLMRAELQASLDKAGFRSISLYGDMTGAAFDAAASGNLVVCARLGENNAAE